jgi:hypothetical protein
LYLLFVVFFCGLVTKGPVLQSVCDPHKIIFEQCDPNMFEFIRSGKEGNPYSRSCNTKGAGSTPMPSPLLYEDCAKLSFPVLETVSTLFASHDHAEISCEKNDWNRLTYRCDINTKDSQHPLLCCRTAATG